MPVIHTMQGVQDVLELYKDRVTIETRSALGFVNKGLKGKKEIPFASMVAVNLKEAGSLTSGYLQFVMHGGNESKVGILAAARDENTFMFADKNNNEIAISIKRYIESAIRREALSKELPQIQPPVQHRKFTR